MWKLRALEGRVQAITDRSSFQLAKLLAVVSGDQLYRIDGYGSFAAYIRARRACWRISVRYAHQLIAAERWVKRVPPGVARTTSERQVGFGTA